MSNACHRATQGLYRRARSPFKTDGTSAASTLQEKFYPRSREAVCICHEFYLQTGRFVTMIFKIRYVWTSPGEKRRTPSRWAVGGFLSCLNSKIFFKPPITPSRQLLSGIEQIACARSSLPH